MKKVFELLILFSKVNNCRNECFIFKYFLFSQDFNLAYIFYVQQKDEDWQDLDPVVNN